MHDAFRMVGSQKKTCPEIKSGAGFFRSLQIASARFAGLAMTRRVVYSLIVRTTLDVGR
jgi:hypothetical protein